jgi:ribosomal protein S27AE
MAEIIKGTVNPETKKVTCGKDTCGFTEKLPPWAIAHGNIEITWLCGKCDTLNLINPWW